MRNVYITVCVVSLLVLFMEAPTPKKAEDTGIERHTGIGEQLALTLNGGSKLRLNTNTSIFIKPDAAPREVILLTGEFFASVCHDDAHPFQVIVNHLVVQDVGTEFRVETRGNVTEVSVTEGETRILQNNNGGMVDPMVGSGDHATRERVVLAGGDLAEVREDGDGTVSVVKVSHNLAEARRKIEWLDGHVSFVNEPLSEAVREVNRYNPVRMVIDDPEAAAVRIGGNYEIGHLNDWLEALRDGFGVDVVPPGRAGGSAQEIHLKSHARHRGRSRNPG